MELDPPGVRHGRTSAASIPSLVLAESAPRRGGFGAWIAGLFVVALLAFGVRELVRERAGTSPASASEVSADRLLATPEPEKRGAEPVAWMLEGQVVDEHGAPIAGAELWIEGAATKAEEPRVRAARATWLVADAVGLFATRAAPSELYVVTASARGFRTRAVALELDRNVTGLEITLPPGPSPKAVVVDPEGKAVAGATVIACAGEEQVTLQSTAGGWVRFGPFAAGCFAVAYHPRFARSLPVRLSAASDVVLPMNPGGSVEGIVTSRSGGALTGYSIRLTSFLPSEDDSPLDLVAPALSVPLGREFRFASLSPGTYTLSVVRHLKEEGEVTDDEVAVASYEVASGAPVRGIHLVTEAGERADLVQP